MTVGVDAFHIMYNIHFELKPKNSRIALMC